MVPEEQFSISCDLAISSIREAGVDFGHYLEFGVSRGTSLACMYHALRNAGLPNVELIGFDSFEGMPSEAASQGWTEGAYASTTGATRRYLVKAGVELGGVHLVKGWFKDTLSSDTATMLNIDKSSLIMVDCDIYTATNQVLCFSPIFEPGARSSIPLPKWKQQVSAMVDWFLQSNKPNGRLDEARQSGNSAVAHRESRGAGRHRQVLQQVHGLPKTEKRPGTEVPGLDRLEL